jgi:predicted amidohydrolase YtcJ
MEMLIEGATVITMAPAGTAEAILIRDGRIAAVGSSSEVRAVAGPGAVRTRLDGATVVPGLIDAHCHITDVGYLASAADCAQPGAPDIPAVQTRLRSASLTTPPSRWVTGAGYVEYKLHEGRHPTRTELDQAVPDRPAVLYHTSLHACVLNSAALREAGFEDGQPDPPGGALGRDDQGRLDGVVFERPMFELFERNLGRDIAAMSTAERTSLARSAGERLAAFGITSVCDADTRRDTLTAFAEADEAGALSQRVYAMVVHDETDWLETSGLKGVRSPYLTASAAKIWSDGGMSSRTAAIYGTYPVPPYGSGILSYDRAELTALVSALAARGLQVCVHAQGDRAIETMLDAFEPITANGNPRRHRIEHAGALYPPLRARAAAQHVVIASQPGFISALGDGFAAAFPETADLLYGFRSWLDAGLVVAGSSDAPVIAADPLTGIRDAVARRTGAGRLLGPDECLTPAQALALYTSSAAYAMHREHEIGSLEPGKLADLTVLDRHSLTEATVIATLSSGTATFGPCHDSAGQ